MLEDEVDARGAAKLRRHRLAACPKYLPTRRLGRPHQALAASIPHVMRAEIAATRVPSNKVRLLEGGYPAGNSCLIRLGKNNANQFSDHVGGER